VISTDGASSLTRSVASNVAQGLQLGSELTGVDLAGLLAKLGQRTNGGLGGAATGADAGRAIDD
jgi:flotillin